MQGIIFKLEELEVVNYGDEDEVWYVNGNCTLAYQGRALQQIGESYDGEVHMIDEAGEYIGVHSSKLEMSDFEITKDGKEIK